MKAGVDSAFYSWRSVRRVIMSSCLQAMIASVDSEPWGDHPLEEEPSWIEARLYFEESIDIGR